MSGRISLILGLLFLISCQRYILPSERIITFDDHGHIIGKGYDAGYGTLITATHVVRACEQTKCSVVLKNMKIPISSYQKTSKEEVTYLSRGAYSPSSPRAIHTGDSLYALVTRSGGLMRVEGNIINPSASYISYDATLSGNLYTGAIQTDMVFEPGESGTPLWTLSGEFVGVVSAVDREKGRSYGVR